jgi:Protein of unknown function (DUF3455)
MATTRTLATMALLATTAGASAAELPPAIAAQGETVVLQVHAVGAQLYDCKADANGRLVWQFREPIASLFADGRTVGRHYAGPSWEVGGSAITGKLVAQAPGAGAKDVAWLKLDVSDHRGDGPLKDVTTVQRINTAGGKTDGACERAGDIHAEPYAADYVFLKK